MGAYRRLVRHAVKPPSSSPPLLQHSSQAGIFLRLTHAWQSLESADASGTSERRLSLVQGCLGFLRQSERRRWIAHVLHPRYIPLDIAKRQGGASACDDALPGKSWSCRCAASTKLALPCIGAGRLRGADDRQQSRGGVWNLEATTKWRATSAATIIGNNRDEPSPSRRAFLLWHLA